MRHHLPPGPRQLGAHRTHRGGCVRPQQPVLAQLLRRKATLHDKKYIFLAGSIDEANFTSGALDGREARRDDRVNAEGGGKVENLKS
jgi:hypothetical protein